MSEDYGALKEARGDGADNKRNSRKAKMGKAREWGAILAAVSALAGAGANYLGAEGSKHQTDVATATTQAKLDEAYVAMRAAVEKMDQADKERDEKLMALREAVAELRGALDVIGAGRVRGASKRAAAAIETIDNLGAPAPVVQLPERPPEPAAEEVQRRLKDQQQKK